MKTQRIPSPTDLLKSSETDIMLLESDVNYTKFYLSDGKNVLSAYTLNFFHGKLSKSFVRINRKFIVNLNFMESFTDQKLMKLNDGLRLSISRRRWTLVKKHILQFQN